MIVRRSRERADLGRGRSLRDDTHEVVGDLKKPAFYLEQTRSRAIADAQLTATEERHHRRVASENPHLAVERGSYNRFRVPLEENRLGRDHGNLEHVRLRRHA